MGPAKPLNLEQFRALVGGGGVQPGGQSVILRALGADWMIVALQRSGGEVVLYGTNTKQPRTFADPRNALLLLREMGIREAHIDARDWTPEQRGLKTTPAGGRAKK
ncbi:hypothetical protein [Noviherbaspirillum aerium]|uniref:hypothetical protein n=1 Tax=Noviherbaspirillum aerium TaxID=2588497 RepID=UPI00124CF76E|nr:hypothetical protein [Noviherbaspirillum aerium]